MNQDALVKALLQPSFYPHHPTHVGHVQTHISHVFIASPYVYKLKKAVRFPFLDFSTAELRRRFCDEELRLNRRLCPEVYLGVLSVTRDGAEQYRLAGPGQVVDNLVWMRELPSDRMLGPLLKAQRVTHPMMRDLARLVAAFHAGAASGPQVDAYATPDALRARWHAEVGANSGFVGHLLAAEDQEVLADFGPAFIAAHEELLRARLGSGRIREGHGDLHAGNICHVAQALPAVDSHPSVPPGFQIFDCIEFSPELRCNDVASEIAFLTMDLEYLGQPDLGQTFLHAYEAAAGDTALRELLPYYASYRAYVRGKVEGLKSTQGEVDAAERARASELARAHFALASRQAWSERGPVLIACTGLSGSGKTALAELLGAATGFIRLSSDEMRKRRAGLDSHRPAPEGVAAKLYTPEARHDTYAALRETAAELLRAGRGVVVDATFTRRAERDAVASLARRQGCRYVFLECVASETQIRARLEARDRVPGATSVAHSDARFATYLEQRASREAIAPDEPVLSIDTGGTLASTRAQAIRLLWHWRCHGPGG
jgi:hypothetical protein